LRESNTPHEGALSWHDSLVRRLGRPIPLLAYLSAMVDVGVPLPPTALSPN
jgi:hypothetical protein